MKIGTFAKKFKINASTVRYYINNGLITPSRPAGQYEFDKEWVADMEKILKYKTYCFTLEEIQLLFFMEKASRFQDDVVVQVCADILKNKRNQLIKNRDDLNRFIDELAVEIEGMHAPVQQATESAGVPFSAFPYLYCPVCQIPLKLEDANISNGSIHKGTLACECGYSATIQDGIILNKEHAEETPFKAFNNVESVMAMKELLSPLYRLLITKTYIWFNNRIQCMQEEPQLILTGPFTFNFLLEYIDKLGKNNRYIIFDPSYKRIVKLKKYLGASNENILYIVGMPWDLPIRHRSVDIYLDDYSTVNSMFTFGTFSTEHLAPLLKPGGEVLGIFTTYQEASKSLLNFKEGHPSFQPEKMTLSGLKYQWSRGNVRMAEQKLMGETTKPELHFQQDVIGEKIQVFGYYGKKEDSQ